jgi:hypothetical protein
MKLHEDGYLITRNEALDFLTALLDAATLSEKGGHKNSAEYRRRMARELNETVLHSDEVT